MLFFKEAKFDLTLVAVLTQLIPPHPIFTTIFVDVFFVCLMRPMWRCIGQVEEEGLFLFAFFDELDAVVCKGIGCVVWPIGGALYS